MSPLLFWLRPQRFVVAASQSMEIRVRRFKKVMLMTAAISGISMMGAGAAQALEACDDQPEPTIENAQFLKCEQEFNSSLVNLSVPVSVGGDSVTNIGNFCTQVAPPSE